MITGPESRGVDAAAAASTDAEDDGIRHEPRHDGPVVVGVDGSAPSLEALRWATREADARGVGLVVLHAVWTPDVPTPPGFTISTLRRELHGWGEQLLREAVDNVASPVRPGLAVRTELSSSEPSRALIDASKGAALVVVGARGRGSAFAVLLGSVSARVSAHAHCPVAVVPERHGGVETPPEERAERGADADTRPAAGDGRGRVVVGLDGSSSSMVALRFALEEAARPGRELVALYALELPMPIDDTTLDPEIDAAAQESWKGTARVRILAWVDEARRANTENVPVNVEVVTGRAVDALLSRTDAAVIVVGSRGRSRITGLLLGSVSQSVLQNSRVPVVVVPNP